MKGKLVVVAAALIAAALATAGCSKTNSGSAGGASPSGGTAANTAAPASAGSPIHLAFVTNNTGEYWTIAHKGVDDAVAALHNKVDVQFVMPNDGTAATQKSEVDDLLAKGIQGIAISPVDPTNQTQELDQAEKQTHVFTQDSDAPQSTRECYIGTDNVAAGRLLGQQIKKALPGGGQIMLFVGAKDAQNAVDRYTGIEDELKGTKIQILDIRTDGADPTKAVSNAADTLVKYPSIAALVGLWSYDGPAIAQAVKAAGKVGKVKIICFDQEDPTLAGIRDGTITATVVQDPYQIGYQSVTTLAKVVQGNKAAIPPSKEIVIPAMVVDKSNIDAYTAKLNKMLGKS